MSKWTPEQQKAHRELWVAALRSGDYRQTAGALKSEDENGKATFCCLGVACDLWLKSGDAPKVAKWHHDGVIQWKSKPKKSDDLVQFSDWKHDGYLPAVVQDWLGLTTHCGGSGIGIDLAMENDSGKSFKQIAQIIEREPKGLIANE